MTEDNFISCVKRNKDRLYLIAFSYMGRQFDAEDAVQIVFLKLWKSETEFEDEVHIDKWLTKVCINECKRTLKYALSRFSTPLEEEYAYPVFDNHSDNDLYTAVKSLKKNERLVIHLFYYEDMSVKEISDLLGIKENAVKTRLHRARKSLKEILGEEWLSE